MANKLLPTFDTKPLTIEEGAFVNNIRDRFSKFAHELDEILPDGPELTVALRHLRDAKNDAILAYIFRA